MNALDFEYDGQYLSDFGFIVCDFDDTSGARILSAGSKITFNTVPRHYGKKHGLTSAKYDDLLQATFDICKDPNRYDDLEITNDEYRDLMRWLNRNEFLKFQVLFDQNDAPYITACYYDASFNIEKIKVREKLYGMRLHMNTNAPFGYGEKQEYVIDVTDASKTYSIFDVSDEIGHIFPDVKITCNESGNLIITNQTANCELRINNCVSGERIEINGDTMIINSSNSSHKILDDFNYEFLRIGNTFTNRENLISASLKCRLEISYFPIIKEAP